MDEILRALSIAICIGTLSCRDSKAYGLSWRSPLRADQRPNVHAKRKSKSAVGQQQCGRAVSRNPRPVRRRSSRGLRSEAGTFAGAVNLKALSTLAEG